MKTQTAPTPSPCQPANVRFWHLTEKGHWVRLTIRPGAPLNLSDRWHNGEGWSWSADTYEIDDGHLVNTYAHGRSDCDGSTRGGGLLTCPIDQVASRPAFDAPGIMLPTWTKRGRGWQRDAYAEAAGY